MNYVPKPYFAQTYGSCAYGNGTEQNSNCDKPGPTTTTSATPSSSSGSLLTNTGFDIALIATIACSIVFIALVVKFWKRKMPTT